MEGAVWSTARVGLRHASVLGADLLAEQLALLVESVVVGSKAYSSVDAVGGPAAGGRDSVVSQGEDVDDCRADRIRPSRRKRNFRQKLDRTLAGLQELTILT